MKIGKILFYLYVKSAFFTVCSKVSGSVVGSVAGNEEFRSMGIMTPYPHIDYFVLD